MGYIMKKLSMIFLFILMINISCQKSEVASKPPMGWNSYTGYSIEITQSELIKNIDAISEKLQPYGYKYVTVDNGWFLDKPADEGGQVIIDAYGRPESSPYFFPDGLQYVIDYAHKKGLKFGIWLIRGVDRKAVAKNLPIKGTQYRLQDIVDKQDTCYWNDYNYGVDMSKPGAQQFYNNMIQKYAEWGVDFIKYDDIVPHPDEIKAVAKAIDNCDRDIVLSLSPGDYIDKEDVDVYKKANMVRITHDIWDNKRSLESTFQRWEMMQDYNGARHNSWIDLDMICFGRLYVVREGGFQCKFSQDQQRTFMLQRALASSPLIAGGVMYSMDDFSLSLLTHPDIIECNQNGKIGQLVSRKNKINVWKTEDRDQKNTGWIGVFNRNGQKKQTIELNNDELGLAQNSDYKFIDLWNNKTLKANKQLKLTINPDGCYFIKYKAK